MQRPLQPAFKIRVYSKGVRPSGDENFSSKGGNYASKGNYSFMDIEECVSWGVTYEEQASLLNTLSFTVSRHADTLLHRMYLGQWVVLYAGYYADNNAGMRKVFAGTVTRVLTTFPNNGKVSFSVECMSYGYTQMGKDTRKNFVYPDPNSKRPFAKGKEEISLKDLITGIVEDAGLLVGEIALPKSAANTKFTKDSIQYQKDMSDWNFLSTLSKYYGCTIWTHNEGGQEYVNFVDTGMAVNTKEEEISFLYPLQGEEGVKDIQSSEIQKYSNPMWNRPRILREVTVEEDISLAYAVTRSAMYYDKTTGETKEVISTTEESDGDKVTVYYELDESKVEFIHRTDPELADQIRSSGATSLPWSSGVKDVADESPEYSRYYYKQVSILDERQKVFDKAFFGITISATCNQDLNIKSQRSYSVRGILRYSTSAKTGTYFLRGLKHRWDKDGALTELDLIK